MLELIFAFIGCLVGYMVGLHKSSENYQQGYSDGSEDKERRKSLFESFRIDYKTNKLVCIYHKDDGLCLCFGEVRLFKLFENAPTETPLCETHSA